MAISDRALAAEPVEELTGLLHKMTQIRRFEEKAAEWYSRGRIKGFLHLYVGQEAVGAGVFSRLRDDDYVFTHYREHGHALARGIEPKRMMAELFGKVTGASRGLGGSMHIFDVSKRFMGGYAIVASQMPLACGAALATKYRGEDGVTLCALGDGAVNEGAFHEALNLASVWKLPVLFLCENNFYGMGTAAARVSATIEIYRRAEAYGIRAEQADGMDVIEMRKRAEGALAYIRSGAGPFFLEAITYRFRGHSMADPELYRDRSEVEHWRGLDPIHAFSDALLRGGHLSQAAIDALNAEVEMEIEDAVRFAEESPLPEMNDLTRYIYAPSPLDGLKQTVPGRDSTS